MAFFVLAVSGVTAGWADAFPYSVDFMSGLNGWTAIDKSETTGVTWGYTERLYSDAGGMQKKAWWCSRAILTPITTTTSFLQDFI